MLLSEIQDQPATALAIAAASFARVEARLNPHDPLKAWPMQLLDLKSLVQQTLEPLDGQFDAGAEFADPRVHVELMFRRSQRIGPVPWLGRGHGIVMLAHQPDDLAFDPKGQGVLLDRLSRIAAALLPLRRGPTVALSAIVLARESLSETATEVLEAALASRRLGRVVTLGMFQIDLEADAFAFAYRRAHGNPFPESEKLAEAFARTLRQFVRPLDGPDVVL